jgi:hypothetical protein
MDSDVSYGNAREALSLGLSTLTGVGMAKKTRAVRRGSERIREETEAAGIRVRDLDVIFIRTLNLDVLI